MIVTKEDCLKCGGLCCFFGVAAASKTWKGIEVGKDGWCRFYDKELKCTIHDDKPQVCKDFEIGCPECVAHRKPGLEIGLI